VERPELGTYILALANAVFDAEIHSRLEQDLKRRFHQLASKSRDTLLNGRELQEAPDDQMVFLKLMAIGFENLQLTEFRKEAVWELQFNPLRALRPSRSAGEQINGIRQPFNPEGFHFNKPFLRKEALWSGELMGLEVDLLFNKFPFVSLHGLLVPERNSLEPQFLSHPYHLYIWSLTETLAEHMPGVGFGYNSLGAFASVNHLHFQMFVREEPLPLNLDLWSHNGGEEEYPLACEVYSSPREAWQRLDALHRDEISYNLVYLPGKLYCLPRKSQGSYEHALWTSGFAWYELAGGVTTFNREHYLALDEMSVRGEMARLGLVERSPVNPATPPDSRV
jgi:hypothetical protein